MSHGMFLLICSLIVFSTVDGFVPSHLRPAVQRNVAAPSAQWDKKYVRVTGHNLECMTQSEESLEPTFSLRRASYLTLWTSLLAYTTYFTSTVTPEAALLAPDILNTAILTPFDGSLSPVFVTLFFFLGILPVVYGSLLLPSAKKQKFWALPFVASSFALGFFGIGPYLGLRNKSPDPVILSQEDRDTGASIFDNKITPLFLLASAIYLVYFAVNGSFEGDRWAAYLQLFDTQPLARISTIDFTILSLAVWDPISEDMKRREYTPPVPAAAFCALPIIGPILYLCLRPSVPQE